MTTKITHFRNKIGLTQEQLADIVGVARQTIIALEQGRYNPSLALAYAITKALKQKHIEEVFKV
jgi:putative transcriptional regulator